MGILDFKWSNEPNVEYKGFVIMPFTIDKVTIGDKEYAGWTSYSIFRNGALLVTHDKEIKFKSVSRAKAFITRLINKGVFK